MTRVFLAKAWIGGVGLVTGLAGIALGLRWLVWLAAGSLAVAFLLRFAGRTHDRTP